jgi:hypothetical protein
MKMTLISATALVAMSFASLHASPDEKKDVLRTISWSEVPLPAGAIRQDKPGGSPTLLVKHDGAKALQLPLWKLEKPGITKKCYALRGKVRYNDVSGIGYFELWNEFAPEKPGGRAPRYFSRSLAQTGPFARITGSSDWREVFIPFDASQAAEHPQALELNLGLPGAGEVEVSSLVLVQFDNAEAMWGTIVTGAASPSGVHEQGARTSALIAGTVCLLGIVAWAWARKGRHVAEARRMKAMDAMP